MTKKNINQELNQDELNGITGGMDSVTGTDGDDTMQYYGESQGNDHDGAVMDGQGGNDHMESSGYTNDVMYGGEGNDTMDGGHMSDYMDGGSGDDSMIGGDGNDTLMGGEGNDVIIGGDGGGYFDDDRIDGGRGDDTMTGGGGEDVFVFNRASGDDVITDFDPNRDTFEFQGIMRAEELTVSTDGDGNTVIHFGDSTVTLQGVSLTVDQVCELAGFESFDPAPAPRPR